MITHLGYEHHDFNAARIIYADLYQLKQWQEDYNADWYWDEVMARYTCDFDGCNFSAANYVAMLNHLGYEHHEFPEASDAYKQIQRLKDWQEENEVDQWNAEDGSREYEWYTSPEDYDDLSVR